MYSLGLTLSNPTFLKLGCIDLDVCKPLYLTGLILGIFYHIQAIFSIKSRNMNNTNNCDFSHSGQKEATCS